MSTNGFIHTAAKWLLLCLAAGSLFACNEEERKPGHQGAAYEIFVVTPRDKWESAIGDTLRSVLTQPVEMINQKEPLFDLYTMTPQGFKGIITRHRNLIFLETGPEYSSPGMTARYDVYSTPQIVVSITGPDDASLAQYIADHRAEVQQIFTMAERDRYLTTLESHGERKAEEEVKAKFGFDMRIPVGYVIKNNSVPDFMWIEHDYPRATQGIAIYSYPYSGAADFEAESLAAHRNEFVKQIPGPVDGSHMQTSPEFFPLIRHMRVHGRLWAELIGFWNVRGDFMGGPFRTFATLNTETNRMVCIDVYVYSPQQAKRNYLRQLETLVYTAKFPGDNTAGAQ